jgi:fructuronate reductase
VIEDAMDDPQPDWASIGVTITNDVAGHERAKLRLLNGAHSSLAYLGSLAGYETVSQAMSDPALPGFLRTLMQQDISPTLALPRGFDLQEYIDTVLRRFANPHVRYQLAQIAGDGSQKLPFRLFGTISDALAAGRSIERLCLPVAAWFHFIRRKAMRDERVADPLAARLLEIGSACTGEPAHDVRLFLTLPNVYPGTLATNGAFETKLADAYRMLSVIDNPASLKSLA